MRRTGFLSIFSLPVFRLWRHPLGTPPQCQCGPAQAARATAWHLVAISGGGSNLYSPPQIECRRKPMRRVSFIMLLALLLAPLFGASPSSAQAWPTRNVKFILTLG